MYKIVPTKDFQKSFNRIRASGKFKKGAQENLNEAVNMLSQGKSLPASYRDHQLKGELRNSRECHIKGDLLLVYEIKKQQFVLVLLDIGTHSYLNL